MRRATVVYYTSAESCVLRRADRAVARSLGLRLPTPHRNSNRNLRRRSPRASPDRRFSTSALAGYQRQVERRFTDDDVDGELFLGGTAVPGNADWIDAARHAAINADLQLMARIAGVDRR